ncbi:MAG: LL-diaminopimelate aminotransferase [Paludibacteraceae bacterium]|nr:LL-diaminopimelate aminotransferase [Paludibacteraceae bacterium]
MVYANDNFIQLPETYLFSEIAKRVESFKAAHPEANIIRMGIGDVTLPLSKTVIQAMHKAVDEMASGATFKGYGPDKGYSFLVDKIIEHDYKAIGVDLSTEEVFVSDGAKSDSGNIGDILSKDNIIAVTDPVYPVYIDTNVMGGRAGELGKDGKWSNIVYLSSTAENGFIPQLPTEKVSVVYLCFPNNPTGTTLTKAQLKEWVDYAIANKVLLLFDAAYEAFITEKDVPHSIYEIEGAKQVAIEFRSYSKTAGFTGTRCSYTIVPKECTGYLKNGKSVSINALWNRRQATKFNGTPYIIQRGAEATYTKEGKKEVKEMIQYYMENARIIRTSLEKLGYEVYGGVNAPYIWLKVPTGYTSWTFFDKLLTEKHIVTTPGVGFGPSGEGYIRLTAFGSKEQTIEAMIRLTK